MLRRIAIFGLTALALAACNGKKSGPVVAKGDGFTITADDFKARIDEQSPFLRARYNTLERKKEFLENNIIRIEVLAREAEKAGLDKDPEVQRTFRRILAQRLAQKRYEEGGTGTVADAEVQQFYDAHAAEYHRPKRVRAAVIALLAEPGKPERAKKMALAQKALSSLQAAEKDPKLAGTAFAKAAAELSEDPVSKAQGGDLGLKTAEELEKATSKEAADAIFALTPNQTSGIIQTPKGLYIAKVSMVQEELNRTLDQVKPQIIGRLARDKKGKSFEEWMKKTRDSSKVTIDEKALDAIAIAPPPGMPPPGMLPPGMTMPPPSAAQKPAMSVQPASGAATPKPADPKASGAK